MTEDHPPVERRADRNPSPIRRVVDTSSRTLVAVLAIVVVAAIGAGLWSKSHPRSEEERRAAAAELVRSVHVSATVVSSNLMAAGAVADFGIEQGIRSVNVRVLNEIVLDLRIEVDRDVTLGQLPVICLVGPYWAPDDAGLSDRCWGDPDLGRLVGDALVADPSGYPLLEAKRPIVLHVTLRRGDERCDYPPGKWQLEVAVAPVVDGSPVAKLDVPPVSLTVPLETGGTLEMLHPGDTRYCGLASLVYKEQGEPPLQTP